MLCGSATIRSGLADRTACRSRARGRRPRRCGGRCDGASEPAARPVDLGGGDVGAEHGLSAAASPEPPVVTGPTRARIRLHRGGVEPGRSDRRGRSDRAPAGGYVLAACFGLAVGCAVGLDRPRGPRRRSPVHPGRGRVGPDSSNGPSRPWPARPGRRACSTASFRLDRVVLAAVGGVATAGVYAAVLPIAEMTTIVQLHLAQLVNAQIADADGGRRWGTLSLSASRSVRRRFGLGRDRGRTAADRPDLRHRSSRAR